MQGTRQISGVISLAGPEIKIVCGCANSCASVTDTPKQLTAVASCCLSPAV